MTSVTAGTFDDALRLCIYTEFDNCEPNQAFPMDVEAAAMDDGPPECEYRVQVLREDTDEEFAAILDAEQTDAGGWRFTFLRTE